MERVPRSGSDMRRRAAKMRKLSDGSITSTGETTSTFKEEVVKSSNDAKLYRVIKLGNGMRVLLISDTDPIGSQSSPMECTPESDSSEEEGDEDEEDADSSDGSERDDSDDPELEEKREKSKKATVKLSAAALCVGIGSFSDPADIPGLSHFLEHMVFMGSEKYPDENDFDAYLRKHGGSTNAYTGCERTVFYFDVQRNFFAPSLDRFAQFFIHPLMKRGSVEREIEAVDSEFSASTTNDRCRLEQLLSSMASPGHPMSKFMWGNSTTLRDLPLEQQLDTYQRLRQHYELMYSAHYMTLAVQSRDSLDVLEEMVVEAFSGVPNNGLKQPEFSEEINPFDNSAFYKLYKVCPVETIHQVILTWSLPNQLGHYRVKPLHYLGWLLGHEGEGSILSYLKHPSRVWALDLFAGNNESNFEHNATLASFQVVISLTEEGLKHVEEVMTCVFEYIAMLQHLGPQEKIFREIQTIEDNSFSWKEECDPVDYVSDMCENMQLFPAQHYITGELLLLDYQPQLIEACQALLTPRCANVTIQSSEYSQQGICQATEKWFNTPYHVEDIPEDWMKKWESLSLNPALHLPAENEYLATDFTLKDMDANANAYPTVVSDTAQSKLWYSQDMSFRVPRAYAYFYLKNDIVNSSAHSAALCDLYVTTLNHILAEVAYTASVALLSYDISVSTCGIEIKCYGFNNKLHKLFDTLVVNMVKFDPTEDEFTAMKKDLQQIYHNCYIHPSGLARELRLSVLQRDYRCMMDRQRALESITLSDLVNFARTQITKKCHVEGLVQGNITVEEALRLEQCLVEKLECTPVDNGSVPEMLTMKLPVATSCLRVSGFNPDDGNSVIANYYQYGPATLTEYTYQSLLMMRMEEPCFDVLRTREQLGYDVYNELKNTNAILGFMIYIKSQASKHSLVSLDSKIEDFLDEFAGRIDAMTEEEFKCQVDALIVLKQCADTSLKVEVDRNWEQILGSTSIFDILKRQVEILESLTLPEFCEWFHTQIKSSSKCRKLSVQVQGNSLAANLPRARKEPEEKLSSHSQPTDSTLQKQPKPPTCEMTSDPEVQVLPLAPDENCTPIKDIERFKMSCDVYPVSRIV